MVILFGLRFVLISSFSVCSNVVGSGTTKVEAFCWLAVVSKVSTSNNLRRKSMTSDKNFRHACYSRRKGSQIIIYFCIVIFLAPLAITSFKRVAWLSVPEFITELAVVTRPTKPNNPF